MSYGSIDFPLPTKLWFIFLTLFLQVYSQFNVIFPFDFHWSNPWPPSQREFMFIHFMVGEGKKSKGDERRVFYLYYVYNVYTLRIILRMNELEMSSKFELLFSFIIHCFFRRISKTHYNSEYIFSSLMIKV